MKKFHLLVSGTKVLALPGGAVPSNHHIIQLVDEIKPKIRELIDNANKVNCLEKKCC